MTRRSRGSGKQTKARRRKAAMPKRDAAPTLRRRSSTVGQESEFSRLRRERDEALEQLSGTSEVLKVISASPGALEPVFNAMLENAVRICGARFGTLVIYEDGAFREVAQYNPPLDFAKARPINSVFRPPPGGTLARIVETKQPVHFEDISVLLQQAKQDKKATPL